MESKGAFQIQKKCSHSDTANITVVDDRYLSGASMLTAAEAKENTASVPHAFDHNPKSWTSAFVLTVGLKKESDWLLINRNKKTL